MKKILFILLLLPFFAESQTYQSMPQAGYGPVKRMLFDSVLTIPLSITSLRNISGGRDVGQLRYNVADSSPYIYSGYQWIKIGGGTGSSQWTDVTGGINYSGGKVGIGTSTPVYKFDVNGTAGATDLEITNSVNVGNGVSTGGILHADGNLETQDSVKFTNLTSKVLDTTNYKPLVIGSTGNVHKTNWFSSGGGSSWSLTGNPLTTSANFIGTTDAQPLVFKTDSVERMRILDNGNIGIGKNNPDYLIDAIGSSHDYVMKVENTETSEGYAIYGKSSGLGIGILGSSVNSDGVNGITTNGIGVSGYSSNGIAGYFQANNTSGKGISVMSYGQIASFTSISPLSNQYHIVFDSIGQVGIGTTTPTATLHLINTFRYQDGNEANGKVLTSDVNGNATWQTAGGSSITTFQVISDADTTLTNVQASYLFKDLSTERTITLPASPTDGLEIQITSFYQNNPEKILTIGAGQSIGGNTVGYIIEPNGTVKLKYYDIDSSWQIISEKL